MSNEDAAAGTKYRLVLKGPGITIEKDIDQNIAAAIAQLSVSGVSVGSAGGTARRAPLSASSGSEQPLSLREFLQQAAASSIHSKIVVVGRFMRDHEGLNDFSREDIRGRFRSAGEPQPANFHRDFQKAVSAGWIAEDPHNKGRFYVTRTGDEAIERGFEARVQSTTSSRHRGRRHMAVDVDASQ